jgi:hypothetical protein
MVAIAVIVVVVVVIVLLLLSSYLFVIFAFSINYNYIYVPKYLKSHTLSVWRCHLDAFFFLNLMLTLVQKFALPVWKLLAFVCHNEISDFNLLHVHFKCHNYPSARHAFAANSVTRDSGICNGRSVLINGRLDVNVFMK